MEDVIDEFLLKVKKHGQKQRLVRFVAKTGNVLKTVKVRLKIQSEIRDIKKTRERLDKLKDSFGLDTSSSGRRAEMSATAGHGLRKSARFMDEAELVGVDETREMLMGWLREQNGRTAVISVVGEGGLGKTAIVNNLYKKQKDERYFDCYAWITVSRSLEAKRLLRTMIRDFDKNATMKIEDDMEQHDLTEKLKQYLQTKKYMIVFDDVRDINFWGNFLNALPEADKGKDSRIIITARNKDIADNCRVRRADRYTHELKPLDPKVALKLFYSEVFDSKGCDDQELKKLSEDFVSKCNGVPLAIVALASLLSTKKEDVSEWEKVRRSLNSKFRNNPHLRSYFQVLSESYDDLDHHLKSCLLYFGLFPEGYAISSTRLINLWTEEGCLNHDDGDRVRTEEVAESYLCELINRSLVKVSARDPDGRVRRCHIHDLMHEFLLKKCEDLDFGQVIKSEQFQFHPWTRRLSILTNSIHDDITRAAKHKRVRSCFCFNLQELQKPLVQSFLSSFKFLKTLDFEDAPLDHLPKAVGTLLHLKYLNLRNTRITAIPKFICKLLNLEILNLKHTLVTELPPHIYQLVKLRHLIAYSSSHGVILKKGIKSLKALQKLAKVDASNDEDGVIEELIHMKEMRRLGIINIRRQHGRPLCTAIENMQLLCSLSIAAPYAGGISEVLSLHSINNPPEDLKRLYLVGRLEKLPNWIARLGRLVKLRLAWSGIEEDPMLALKDLTDLVDLQLLKSAYDGEELHFKSGWFKKLKVLELRGMQRLRRLRIESAAMSSLEHLQLGSCHQIEKVPSDIPNLRSLKFLHLEDMSRDFVTNMQQEGYYKFSHLSSVTYSMDDGHNLCIYP
ncbi:disease resistance protein RPM1-like isoform X2 [Prosopis cineraria]|nr:disease resistance protein RPM1-like isoform X2 [Prosopis cineraria]